MTLLAQALLTWTRTHGVAALLEKQAAVAGELLDGVTVTSVSFDGSSGSGQANRDPAVLLGVIEEVLAHLEGRPDPMSAAVDFSQRFIRT